MTELQVCMEFMISSWKWERFCLVGKIVSVMDVKTRRIGLQKWDGIRQKAEDETKSRMDTSASFILSSQHQESFRMSAIRSSPIWDFCSVVIIPVPDVIVHMWYNYKTENNTDYHLIKKRYIHMVGSIAGLMYFT